MEMQMEKDCAELEFEKNLDTELKVTLYPATGVEDCDFSNCDEIKKFHYNLECLDGKFISLFRELYEDKLTVVRKPTGYVNVFSGLEGYSIEEYYRLTPRDIRTFNQEVAAFWEKQNAEWQARIASGEIRIAKDGYFICWECGREMPLRTREDDGTCGC